MVYMQFDELSNKVLGCAITVHRELGPGLFESAYERCLLHELKLNGLEVAHQVNIDLRYKDLFVPGAYRADIIVAQKLLVELKCVESFSAQHSAQILTHLKLTRLEIGLLVNFSLPTLRQGVRRFVLSQQGTSRIFA
jgi:GxxExxY protein